MNIVITGGLGFIGQNLALNFKRKKSDWSITAIDWFENASEQEESLFDVVHHSCFADNDILEVYKNADVIIHLAAYTTVQESIHDPLRSLDNNVSKTIKVLDYLRNHSPDSKFIFASTGGAIIGDYDGSINEDIVARPLSPYGASKLAVEGLLSAYQGSFGLKYASMRFSNVYGPNSFRKSSVIAAYCKMYLNDGTLQVNGDGKQTRDYIFVDDVCEAIYQVITKNGEGVYQLGTGIGTSINDIVQIFGRIYPDQQIKTINAPALKGEVRHNKADISHIKQSLGFEPRYDVETGVRETLEWFQKQSDTSNR